MTKETITLDELSRMGACPKALMHFLSEFGPEEASIKTIVTRLHQWQKLGGKWGKEAASWEVWLLSRNSELTEALLKNGANVNVKDGLSLSLAVLRNDPELVKILLTYGARTDTPTLFPSAYEIAVESKHFEIAQMLKAAAEKTAS